MEILTFIPAIVYVRWLYKTFVASRHSDAITQSDVLVQQERDLLEPHREARRGKNAAALPRTGIALSGGGIRAAIVSIGALQALASLDLLKDFDLISGVSGGSYASAALQWWWSARRRAEQTGGATSQDDLFGTGPEDFPYGTRRPNPQYDTGHQTITQEQILSFLRWHGSYLIPGDGITLTSGIAVVLRTLFLNLLVFVPIAALFFVPINLVGYITCARLPSALADIVPQIPCTPYDPPRNVSYVTAIAQSIPNVIPTHLADALEYGLLFNGALWASYLIVLCFAMLAATMALLSRRSYESQSRVTLRTWLCHLLVAFILLVSLALILYAEWLRHDRRFFFWDLQLSLQITYVSLFVGVLASSLRLIFDTIAFFESSRKLAINAAYVGRRSFEKWAGRFFIPTITLFLFGTIQIIPYYLYSLQSKLLPGALAALTTILGAASSLYGHMAVVQNVIPGLGARIVAGVASAVFTYSLLVIGYSLSVFALFYYFNDSNVLVHGLLISFAILALAICFFANINNISLHQFYRDRLMEAFMPDKSSVADEKVHYASGADRLVLSDLAPGLEFGKIKQRGELPYPIISANAILVNDQNRKVSSRGGDSFLLSPLFVGCNATGWRRTDSYQAIHGALTLASAVAASGAAQNARAAYVGKGFTRDYLVSIVMTLLNMRLGMWVANPKRKNKKIPRYYHPVVSYGLFGGVIGSGYSANSDFLELSDGGHFENLGLYELVRRKTEIILLIDAEEDEKLSFPGFVSAIARIRSDFQVTFKFAADKGPEYLAPDQDLKFPYGAPSASQPYFVCLIDYGTSKGVLIYIKSALIKDLSVTALGYKAENDTFPSQNTLNQFFEPPQFEAYRELGFQSATIVARDLELQENINSPQKIWWAFARDHF